MPPDSIAMIMKKKCRKKVSPYVYPGVVYNKDSVEGIVGIICDYFGVTKEQLKSRDRSRSVVVPRQMALYFVMKYIYPRLSFTQIAWKVAKRHYSTIYNSIEQIENLREYNEEISQWADDIEEMLNIPGVF